MSEFELGLGKKGRDGSINIAEFKGGIKKENVAGFENIFSLYDKDNNQVLTDDEIQQLKTDIKKYSSKKDDSIFSEKEAKSFNKDFGLDKKNVSALFDFLKIIQDKSANLISAVASENGNSITTKFKDEQGNEVTDVYNKNTKVSEQVYSSNGKTIKTILQNGVKQKEVITDESTGTEETTTFESDGKTIKSKVTIEKSPARTTTTEYESGVPKSEKVVSENEEIEYVYDSDGNKKPVKKIENKTDASKIKTTEYQYNDDGTSTETINDYTGTTVISYNGKDETSRVTTQNGKTTTLLRVENGYTETVENSQNNSKTVNLLNDDKQRLTQTKTVGNKEYSLNYDGEGNITDVVVQFGENIDKLCKKFGCTKEELLEVNKDIVKTGKKGRKYFPVGAVIKIPDKGYKLDADNKVFKNRKDSAGAVQDYRNWQAEQARIREERARIRAQHQAEDRELAARSGHGRTFIENKWNTFREMAIAYYKREGNLKPTKRQIQLRIDELKRLNPQLNDGQIKGKRVIATFNAETDASIGAGQQRREVAHTQQAHRQEAKTGKSLARTMYAAIDDHWGGVSESSFQTALSKVNSKNVVGLLKQYNQLSPDETLIEAIMDETGNTLKTRKAAVTRIINALIARAKSVGLSSGRQKQALTACQQELQSYWSMGIGYCQTSKLDGLINNLIGAIDAAEAVTREQRSRSSGNGINETLGLMNDQVSTNTKALNDQLAKDGWAADLYEGLKWCVGSDNLDENVKADLKKYKGYIAQLQRAGKTGGVAAFKAEFKKIFGVEYDANLIRGYNNLQTNFAMAQGLTMQKEGFYKEFGNSIQGKENYNSMRARYGKYLVGSSNGQINDANLAVDNAIKIQLEKKKINFANATPAQKAAALREIISNTYKTISGELNNYTNGQSLEAMKRQLANAGSAVFGNKHDIAFRVNDYISSQQQGGAAVNMAAKAAAAIAIAVATGGTGLVALTTAAALTTVASATIDITDRVSSDVGLQEGEIKTILRNAAVDGVSVFAGGMVGKYAMMFKNANAFVQAGGRLTMQMAGDVATGAAAEYVQTGTITLEGVAFQAVFSAAGNLVSLKAMGKAKTPAPKPKPKPDPAPAPAPKPDPAPAPAPKPDPAPAPAPKPDPAPAPAPKPDPAPAPAPKPDPAPAPAPKPDPAPAPAPVDPIVVDPKTLRDYYPTPSAETVKFKKRNFFGKSTTVEVRTADDVRAYLTSFNRRLPDAHIEQMVKLFESNPKRFNRIANSGLFDLINKGHIDDATYMRLFSLDINENTFFSNRTLSEISLVKSQVDQGLKPSLVKTIPGNAVPKDWVKTNVRVGEAVELDGKIYVRSSADQLTEIKMTKQKFDELFPPIGGVCFNQGNIGDCWLVSAIDNMMDYPQGRASIYSMFEQVGDDIYVTIPGASKSVKFDKGIVLDAKGNQISGTGGIKMIEQAYMYHALDINRTGLTPAELAELTDVPKQMKILKGGWTLDAWQTILKSHGSYVFDADAARALIMSYSDSATTMMELSFRQGTPIPGMSEGLIDSSRHMYADHAYALKSFDPTNNMCYLTNPWDSSKIIEIPLDDVLKHFKALERIDLNTSV